MKKILMEKRTRDSCKIVNEYKAKLSVFYEVNIKDISISGLYVETYQNLTPDNICRIELVSSNNEKITLQCVVRCSDLRRTLKENGNTLSVYGIGLKFIKLTDSEKLFLEKYIAKLTN